MRTRAFAAAATLAAGATFGLAGPAAAAPPQQSGLVNVNVTDLTVQIPIGIAANVCDLNIAVLAQDLLDDAADCDANVENGLEVTPADGGPTQQEGLVNVNLEDIAVQVPIGVAANICDVNVAVLVSSIVDDAARCDADADNTATVTPA